MPHLAAMDPQLPTFILIGAMKAGTTSLIRYLGSHPDVFCPRKKEPNYFAIDTHLDKPGAWSLGLDWYRSRFEPGRDLTARGEGSTPYTMAHPGGTGPDDGSRVAERIREQLPDVRLMYVMRNPADRIESQYAHLMRLWRVDGEPIDEAIRRYDHFLDISRYSFQLRNYLEVFPREQLLLLQFEELVRDPESVVRRAFEFIGVDPDVELTGVGERHNERPDEGLPKGRGVALLANRARHMGITNLIPMGLRKKARSRLTRSAEEGEFHMSERSRAWVWEQLSDDLAGLDELGAGWMVEDWRASEESRAAV